MGFLDRIRSVVASARGSFTPELRGPLGLAPGDGVGFYRERWAVAGVRRLDADGALTWQYCLESADGGPALLTCLPDADGGAPEVRLERPLDAATTGGISWDQDEVALPQHGTFRLARTGRASARHGGDTPSHGGRNVRFRELTDGDGDVTLVLEDWTVRREARVAEPVHEAELTLVRGEGGGAAPEAFWNESTEETAAARKGSPIAAALALAGRSPEPVLQPVEDEDPEAREPEAYADDEWNEGDGTADAPAAPSPLSVTVSLDTEDDEWLAATAYLRAHGMPQDRRPRRPA